MVDFKKELAKHLNDIDTNPYLFVGSGISRRYINTPTWIELLKEFSERLQLKKNFGYYDSKSAGDLPKLASLIANEFHEIWWTDDAFIDSRSSIQDKRITSTETPLKIELAKYLKEKEITDFNYPEEISLLRKVIIDGIITTNWDSFLENIFEEYQIYIGQEQLLFSENISIGDIYKIHGCVTCPESLIITTKDYDDFKKKNTYLAAKLLTTFVEHPVFFLGYSISDPNISDILFSLTDCLDNHNIDKLKNRLIFVEWEEKQIEPVLLDGTLRLANGKILPIKHIKTNSFIPLYEVLANLKQRLPVKVLKRFQNAVYEFIKTNEPTDKIYVGDLTTIDNNTNDVEFVIGVGVASSFAKQGLLGIDIEDVVEDVLFNNKHIPSKEFISTAIPQLLKMKKRAYIPLYKYFRGENALNDKGELVKKNTSPIINDYFKDKSHTSFYPKAKTYSSKIELIRNKYKTMSELIADNDKAHCFYYIPLLEREKINLNELHHFLVQCFKSGDVKNTYFKVLVCYYDYLKYGLNEN